MSKRVRQSDEGLCVAEVVMRTPGQGSPPSCCLGSQRAWLEQLLTVIANLMIPREGGESGEVSTLQIAVSSLHARGCRPKFIL